MGLEIVCLKNISEDTDFSLCWENSTEIKFPKSRRGKNQMDFQEENLCALAKGLSYLGSSHTLIPHL